VARATRTSKADNTTNEPVADGDPNVDRSQAQDTVLDPTAQAERNDEPTAFETRDEVKDRNDEKVDKAEAAQEESKTGDDGSHDALQDAINSGPTKEAGEEALADKPEVREDRERRGVAVDAEPVSDEDRKKLEGLTPNQVSNQLHAQVRQFDTSGLSGQREDITAAYAVFQHPARDEDIRQSEVSEGGPDQPRTPGF